MQPTFTRFGHMFLTLDHQLQLCSHFPELPEDVLVPRHKAESLVLDTCFVAEADYQLLQPSKIMTWDAGEQMVYGLELQAPMNEIEPWRTLDVHCCTELMLREAFRFSKFTGRHRPMRQGDLHVQGHGDDVGDQNEHYPNRPCWKTPPDQTIAKEEPIY